MTILVAEDDRDIADLIAHYLQKPGWAPHIATAGDERSPTRGNIRSISSFST